MRRMITIAVRGERSRAESNPYELFLGPIRLRPVRPSLRVNGRAGLTLIELIIGLLLSSLLITALFTIYGTISKTVAHTQAVIARDRAVAIFQYQWQKDIEGIFAPPYPEKEVKKPETKKQDQEAKKIAVDQEKKQEKPKPLKKIFDVAIKDKSLAQCTFITSNPVAVYEKSQTGAKPRMVRVVYRLEADKEKKDMYKLIRQQSDEVAYEKFSKNAAKPIKGYELLGNIKLLKLGLLVGKEEKKEGKDDKKKKKGKKFKSFAEWSSDERLKEEKEAALLPQFIKTTLVIVDPTSEQEFKIEFTTQIAAYNQKIVATQPKKHERPPPASQDKKAPPAGGKPPAQQGAQQVAVQTRTLYLPQSPRLNSLLEQIGKQDEKGQPS